MNLVQYRSCRMTKNISGVNARRVDTQVVDLRNFITQILRHIEVEQKTSN